MRIFTQGSPEEERIKVIAALILAILFHLIVILALAAAANLRLSTPPAPKEEKPMELTVLKPPPPKLPQLEPAYVETTEAQRSEKPPENPVFQSDKDTQAGSTQPALGQAPLPTQEGEQQPIISFENHNYTPGGGKPQPAVPVGTPAPRMPETAQSTPAPEATPDNTPKPAPTPRETSQLALLEPPKSKEKPQPTPPPQPADQSQQPPSPYARNYQGDTRITRIQGNISNRRDRSSVAALGTPLGRYKKQVSDAIGSRWYYYVKNQIGLFNVGTAEVRFIVKADGKVEKFQIVSNTSNESFASCTAASIMNAEIPPIPKDLLPMLEGGCIEIEFSFTILSN